MKATLTVIGLSVSLLMATQVNAKNQMVYDSDSLDNSKASDNKCSGLDCLLRMGTFSSEKYANRYKDHISKKTNRPVIVERDQDDKNIFHVIVGPFNDFATMLKSSMELSGKPVRATSRAATSATRNVFPEATAQKTAMPRYVANNKKTNVNRSKRTVARSTSKGSTPQMYQTKHQQLLASQADYPAHQPPKTDAKGNVIPLFEAGPYLGLSTGVIIDIGKAPLTAGYQGFDGVVSAGAGHMFTRRFYMGGEFYYGSTITAHDYRVGIEGFSIENGWFYGASFIPGLMINDTVLGFLRVGVMRNQFKATPRKDINEFNRRLPYSRRVTSVINGLQVGVGGQTNLYKNLDIRAEYNFAYFQSIHTDEGKGNVNLINIGLVYKFPDALRRA